MKNFIIDNEEKKRILNLHESFKRGLLNEQVSGSTSGTTSGATNNSWGKEPITTGPVIGKVYSTTIMQDSGVQEPVTFDIKVSLRKSSSKDSSWLGYAMWIYDNKSNKMMDQLSIDCKTVSTYINSLKSKKWSQLDHFGNSQYKWYFNQQFLNDLYQTLGCK